MCRYRTSKSLICIPKCPQTYWTYTMGMSSGLELCSDNLNTQTKIPISQLVAEKICPPYILPSKSVMGMSIPKVDFRWKECERCKKD